MTKEQEIIMSKKISWASKYSIDLYKEIIEDKNLDVQDMLATYLMDINATNQKATDKLNEFFEKCMKNQAKASEKYEIMHYIIRYIYEYLKKYEEYKDVNIEEIFRTYSRLIQQPKEIKKIPDYEVEKPKQR